MQPRIQHYINATLKLAWRALRVSVKVLIYVSLATLALASFEYLLPSETAEHSILWRHLVLVGWAIAAAAYVAVRTRSNSLSARHRITDMLVAAAIAYAATPLVAETLTDMHRELDTIRSSPLWQILLLVELVLLFEGTRRIIEVTISRCRMRDQVTR